VHELSSGQKIEESALPLIGGRRFWVYRADPSPGVSEGVEAFNAAFEELDGRYQVDRSGPIGICVPVSDPELMRRSPQAVWPETELLYAGRREDGVQLRVRYFYDATVGPGMPESPTIAQSEAADYSLPPGYRMVPFAETDAVGPEDVVEFWTSERAIPDPREAERRVEEVRTVALDPGDGLAAVSTVYLKHNAQLDLDMWHLRGFVGQVHRMGNLATRILWATRDHLREQWESGAERRGPGVLLEVENRLLMTYFNRAFWVLSDFWFIGETDRSAHLRVHYFPGAEAPIPQ
jgi:hypothetical protein